ncbi:uncharacterized protein LOC116760741 isoform X4 [Phocoena sinus]|nr:uncharacterized protein LOC116760741 isoform X4 [Phocoena sinus]XP_032501963.1 uncharacterized protein LOC116760741 isoform X4 [Phocoena sinus]XP_032501964.1 uncharacterized protein LOC116760741 isoform X4 [Phocoena sinus]
MAGPRAPPRKCTPVVAFKRRSRTTRPGGWCLPCVWVVRQPRRSHPFFPAPWSLADIWSLDDRATLRSRSGTEMGASIRGQPYSMVSRALGRGHPRSRGHLTAVPLFPAQPEPTGGLALGPRAGDGPTPGLGVGARPLLLNAQRTVTGHRTAQGVCVEEERGPRLPVHCEGPSPPFLQPSAVILIHRPLIST